MNNLARFRSAPITTSEAKLNIFAPVEKILDPYRYRLYTTIFEDDRLKIEVSGTRLTQIHRDILDIALFYGSWQIEEQVEQAIPVRTFSLYQIQKRLQYKACRNNAWVNEKLQELKRATIVIHNKSEQDCIEFNIIRVAKRSEKIQEYVIVLEELYFEFFEKSISIDYKKLLPDILRLKHPQTKAVVRYMLSHRHGHQINIDKLLSKVGVQGGKRNIEMQRKAIIRELLEIGEKFNISLIKTSSDNRRTSDITIKYTKHPQVKIYYPKNQPSLKLAN